MSDEMPFWVVWNPAHGVPTMRHGSAENALNEARRLARAHPGEEFIVMQPIKKVRTHDPVEVIDYDDIPF